MIALIAALTLFGFWMCSAVVLARGARRMARLSEQPPDGTDPLPTLSIVVAARNEEAAIEPALRTLLALDYPALQIIAVDDRSGDRTGGILDRLTAESSRLRVERVRELPVGWLGKNHALHAGAQAASGEWILFTDADVHFAPDALLRAVRYALSRRLDHMAAYPEIEVRGFWETLFVLVFGSIFQLHYRPWDAPNPRSKAYIGIGAFNLVRAKAYRAMGGHARLPFDVADDMKLGLRMKQSGARQECVQAAGMVRVRWLAGLRGAIGSLEKNAFAGADYNPWIALGGSAALLSFYIGPVAGLFAGPAAARLLFAACIAVQMASIRFASPPPRPSPLYALALPLGAMLFVYTFHRSMVLAYRRGGIVWRGTLYPLDDLRRGIAR